MTLKEAIDEIKGSSVMVIYGNQYRFNLALLTLINYVAEQEQKDKEK